MCSGDHFEPVLMVEFLGNVLAKGEASSTGRLIEIPTIIRIAPEKIA